MHISIPFKIIYLLFWKEYTISNFKLHKAINRYIFKHFQFKLVILFAYENWVYGAYVPQIEIQRTIIYSYQMFQISFVNLLGHFGLQQWIHRGGEENHGKEEAGEAPGRKERNIEEVHQEETLMDWRGAWAGIEEKED